jgi:hypothetical protein
MRKTIIIIGAGASFSAPQESHNQKHLIEPPLVNSLFDNRFLNEANKVIPFQYNLPNIMGLIFTFSSYGNMSFEDYMSDIYEKIVTKKIPKNSLLNTLDSVLQSVYYLQALFNRISQLYSDQITLYDGLINRLSLLYEDICIINFNYDLLLEQAIQRRFKTPFDQMNSYIDGNFKLLKPHGSCNWAYSNVPVPQNSDTFDDKIQKLDRLTSKNVTINKDSAYYPEHDLFPCMVMPINYKEGFFKKKFVFPTNHYEEMRKQLSEAEQILIIGWSGKENHFGEELKELCSDRKIKKVIVDLNGAKKTSEEIGNYIDTKDVIPFDYGFKNFLGKIGFLEEILA